MRKYPARLLISLLAAASLPHFAFAANAKEEAGLLEFTRLDANKDGKVSGMEHAAFARLIFIGMDENKDRLVSPAEMSAADLKISGAKPAKTDAASVAKIKTADTNKDGLLTSDEQVATARVIFNKMDKNKDGFLSQDEVLASHGVKSAPKK